MPPNPGSQPTAPQSLNSAVPIKAVRSLMVTLSVGFWRGPIARTAWILTLGALACEAANIALQLAINYWNRQFFDALERRSADDLWWLAVAFIPLAVAATAAVVGAVLLKVLLQTAWRQSVTEYLQQRWLSRRAFYRLTVLYGADLSPEQRFTDDARLTVEPVVDLTIGFLSAFATFVAFSIVLWTVGGSMVVYGVTIPGFMVLTAVIYASIVWTAMMWLGAPYTQRVRERSEAEARFRFELTRVRENAESIALIGGADGEDRRLRHYYTDIAQAWTAVAWRWSIMTWVSHGNAVFAPIIPLLLMAPKYLSGEVSLGVVMQAAAAFGSVQAAMGWFTTNYARLSEWYASASRIAEIDALISAVDGHPSDRTISLGTSNDGKLYLLGVAVELHDGRAIVPSAELVIEPGEMVIVVGEAGTGKSSLIRAIAGLWPWGRGTILLPAGAKMAFLPQRPYIPIGTLAAATTYPAPAAAFAEHQIREALVTCGLEYIADRLPDVEAWDKVLSGGEQQRLAFARLLLDRPTIAILDEATSALDEDSQQQLMELFRFRLATTTVISVSHRPSLARFHSRQIELTREIDGVRVAMGDLEMTLFAQMRRALARLSRI